MQVYDYTDYREFLNDEFPVKGEKRGRRRDLAKFIGCQSGFISQVFSGLSDFSLEHGIKVVKFLHFSPDETNYFLLLIQYTRAGNPELRKYFKGQIQGILLARKSVKKRIKVNKKLSDNDCAKYYSNWIYAAIHTIVGIPSINTRIQVATRLGIMVEESIEALEFLIDKGLVSDKDGKLITGKNRIHLPMNSPFINQHHNNWRLKSMNRGARKSETNLHYSGVITLSKSDGNKIQEIFLKSIENMEKILAPSKEETIYTVSIDYFEL